ncbi:hypothetical protein HED51_16390 [Ochrobactrum grignonense]|nr:hypothetical protein [Brucella grignonensis]
MVADQPQCFFFRLHVMPLRIISAALIWIGIISGVDATKMISKHIIIIFHGAFGDHLAMVGATASTSAAIAAYRRISRTACSAVQITPWPDSTISYGVSGEDD